VSSGKKISTSGGESLGQNPFAALSGQGLPQGVPPSPIAKPAPLPATGSRGRVDVRRETGGRGGKTVTVVDGFVGIGLPEKEKLAKKMRAAAGCGGTVKDGAIEIQGDQREVVMRILAEAGFRPVRSGG